jgi:glycogen operon protein
LSERLVSGAVWTGGGVRFTVRSRAASAVEVCLFDTADAAETSRHALSPTEDGLWSLAIEGLEPGQLYGYRVHGRFAPEEGHRANPAKLLVDPWARAVTGEPLPDAVLFGGEEAADDRDSATAMPKCVVVDSAFDWHGDMPPAVPWGETVIYEAHVRGLTALHPEVPPELRGTYLGLAEPAVLAHLRRLGVTAIELMPVHQIATERPLAERGLRNYFGYNPLATFAPHSGYAAGGWRSAVTEFKTMVGAAHRAGIEVLLDVVLNHTPEGDHWGPTLSLRGFDNSGWYLLDSSDPRRYANHSGCGNTLDFGRPQVREWALDCLSYWVEEMHVDGFRFDLAAVLGRSAGTFAPDAPFFQELAARPALAGVKLIAEPWDLGPGGYLLGAFPDTWSEWNDRFRDGTRAFWRGDRAAARDLRAAFLGSAALFSPPRSPRSGISYVSCHDGFTLADLVSYEEKRNWQNGEENRDGSNHNLSRNWGAEGPTSDPDVLALRDRVRRALLATLALSRGVPMIGLGDELGRTQAGNNNPYCHDSELTWLHWAPPEADRSLCEFARQAFALRREHEVLRRDERPAPGEAKWLGAHGGPLGDGAGNSEGGFFGLLLEAEPRLLLLFNGDEGNHLFRLPRPSQGRGWRRRLDSAQPERSGRPRGRSLNVAAHSLVVLEEGLACPSHQLSSRVSEMPESTALRSRRAPQRMSNTLASPSGDNAPLSQIKERHEAAERRVSLVSPGICDTPHRTLVRRTG